MPPPDTRPAETPAAMRRLPAGAVPRRWRGTRGLTQGALEAGISARHLSFIGTGRSAPGHATLLRLREEAAAGPLRDGARRLPAQR